MLELIAITNRLPTSERFNPIACSLMTLSGRPDKEALQETAIDLTRLARRLASSISRLVSFR